VHVETFRDSVKKICSQFFSQSLVALTTFFLLLVCIKGMLKNFACRVTIKKCSLENNMRKSK